MSKNPKNQRKSMKIAIIDIEDLHILNDLRNFNEIFKKDMTIHFWCQIDPPPSDLLGLKLVIVKY